MAVDHDASGPADELPVIELVAPMPGFPDLTRFALVQVDDEGVLNMLTSLEEPDVRFLVLPPGPFFPDYAPVIDDETAAALELSGPEDALLLAVVNTSADLASPTVNLAAPIVVNIATRRAAQVILDDPGLSLSVPLLAA